MSFDIEPTDGGWRSLDVLTWAAWHCSIEDPDCDLRDVEITGWPNCDFGGDWQHDIRCIAHHAPDSTPSEPHCVAGEGACPPEDVGGTHGYREYLGPLRIPSTPNAR